MTAELTYIHQRYLSLTQPRPDQMTSLPTRLQFASLRTVILEELYTMDCARGGPLFGHVVDGVITVAASPSGYCVLDPTLASDPLSCDARQLFGWIDSLNFGSETAIDCVSTQVMWPNSMLGSLKHELACLRRGQETDLVSANHCLCALWEDSILTIRAYTWASYKDEMGRLSTNLQSGRRVWAKQDASERGEINPGWPMSRSDMPVNDVGISDVVRFSKRLRT